MAALTQLSVDFLSLVKRPATGKAVTLKSAKPGQRVAVFDVAKTDDERMMAFGIVYAPNQPDAHGDTADAQTIRRAAYEFMREGRHANVDAEHSFSREQAYVAESWITRSGDTLFPDEPEGAWAVGIQVGDPDLWRQLKNGDLTGISLAGTARADEPSPTLTEKTDAQPGWFRAWLKSMTGTPSNPQDDPEETTMNEDQVRTLVRDTIKAELAPALQAALKGEDTPPAPSTPPAASQPAEPTDVAKAITDGFAAIEGRMADAVAKAVAKGVTETDGFVAPKEDTFA